MTIYTTVADSNGDFTVPFSSAYTSGEKITVTAEIENATKTIEIYAPSEVIGGGAIQFTGTLDDFPNNIGGVIISKVNGNIGDFAFQPESSAQGGFQRKATSLEIKEGVTNIGVNCFKGWGKIQSLILPEGLLYIQSGAFSGLSIIKSITLPDSVLAIASFAFEYCSELEEITFGKSITALSGLIISGSSKLRRIYCLAEMPPTIASNTLNGLHSSAVIYVPSGSVSAYQSTPNWSDFASRIQAI